MSRGDGDVGGLAGARRAMARRPAAGLGAAIRTRRLRDGHEADDAAEAWAGMIAGLGPAPRRPVVDALRLLRGPAGDWR